MQGTAWTSRKTGLLGRLAVSLVVVVAGKACDCRELIEHLVFVHGHTSFLCGLKIISAGAYCPSGEWIIMRAMLG